MVTTTRARGPTPCGGVKDRSNISQRVRDDGPLRTLRAGAEGEVETPSGALFLEKGLRVGLRSSFRAKRSVGYWRYVCCMCV